MEQKVRKGLCRGDWGKGSRVGEVGSNGRMEGERMWEGEDDKRGGLLVVLMITY